MSKSGGHRASQQRLAAVPVAGTGPAHSLLRMEDDEGQWRLVELFSLSGAPFDVQLSWSAGSGSGSQAWLSVGRASRVSVFARSLAVEVRNRSGRENRVGATVSDGFIATENVLEVVGEAAPGQAVRLELPPFARRLWLSAGEAGHLEAGQVSLYDGQGVRRAVVSASELPASGLVLGAAEGLELSFESATAYRALFSLSL